MHRISDVKTVPHQNQQRNLVEDMDLIDILWRQDIDLGITRDMFDASLRQEHEKELKEKQVNATEEQQQPNDIQNSTVNVASALANQSNFAVDNETGELIPVTPSISADDVMELFQQINGLQSNNTNSLQANDLVALKNFTNQNETFDSFFDEYGFQSLENFDNENFTAVKSENTAGAELQSGGGVEEETWQDMLSLLAEEVNLSVPLLSSSYEHQPTISRQDSNSLIDIDLLTMPGLDNLTLRNPVLFSDDDGMMQSNVDMWNTSSIASNSQQYLMNNVSLAQTIAMPYTAASLLNDSVSSLSNYTTPLQPLQTHGSMTSLINTTSNLLSPIFSLNQTTAPLSNLTALLTGTYTNATFSDDIKQVNQTNEALGGSLPMLNMSQPMTLAPYANNDTFIQQLLQNDLSDLAFDEDNLDEDNTAFGYDGLHETWSTDSAVSSMHSPSRTHEASSSSYLDDAASIDGMEELEGATGGSSKDEIKYSETLSYTYSGYDIDNRRFRSISSSNTSLSTNSSQHEYDDMVKPTQKQVAHNHTYYLQPGQKSREEKEREARREREERATRCKDAKRAQMLKIPFSVEEIIDLPVDQFTELLSRYTLSEAQHQLIRDIRRRGKNKAAAQNCRKRKLEVIQSLEDEVEGLRLERDKLQQNKMKLTSDTMMMKEKFARLQADMLRSLRDPNGRPYNPDEFTLQRTSDGDIILVPRSSGRQAGVRRAQQENDDREPQKRKPKRKE